MKRRFLAVLIAVVMVVSAVIIPTTVVSAAGVNVSFNALLLLRQIRSQIKFYDGEELVATVKMAADGTVEAPELEAKEGYDFDGWYADEELTEKYDFETPVKYGSKFYAKWVEAVVEEEVTEDETTEAEDVVETPADEEVVEEEATEEENTEAAE